MPDITPTNEPPPWNRQCTVIYIHHTTIDVRRQCVMLWVVCFLSGREGAIRGIVGFVKGVAFAV